MLKPYRLVMLALLLAACAGPPAQSTPAPTTAPVAANTDVPTLAAVVPTEAGKPTEALAEDTAAPTAAATAVEAPSETRTPRLELAATDPSTVSLAAGRPQLVEFFAFW
jgi:hypothetical protein